MDKYHVCANRKELDTLVETLDPDMHIMDYGGIVFPCLVEIVPQHLRITPRDELLEVLHKSVAFIENERKTEATDETSYTQECSIGSRT